MRKNIVEFNLKLLRGENIAVNCVTEEQAQQFVDWVCGLTGRSVLKDSYWLDHGKDTCYNLERHLSWKYGVIDWYTRNGYKVISYEEALLKPSKQFQKETIREEAYYENKIKNLHNIINKQNEKNQNQKLELTLLLSQKEELKKENREKNQVQDKLNMANRTVKIQMDIISELNKKCTKYEQLIKCNDFYIEIKDYKIQELQDLIKDYEETLLKVNNVMKYLEDKLLKENK